MSISARNQLNVEITEVRTGAVNSLISAKLAGGEVLKATVTVDSEKGLDLKVGKKAIFYSKLQALSFQKMIASSLALQTKSKVLLAR